jgi:hypothetical protein
MDLKVIMNYPQACHNTSILPLFPRIEEVPREVIWDSFSKREVPNDVVYNLGYQKVFSDEDPSKVQDPFSLHDSFFVKNDKALLYKQGWFYTKGSSYLLPVRLIEEHPFLETYIFNFTMHIPRAQSLGGSFYPYVKGLPFLSVLKEISIPRQDPNAIAAHVRLGDRNPKLGTDYPGTSLSLLKERVDPLIAKGLEIHIFTDDPDAVSCFFNGYKRLSIKSQGDALSDLIALSGYQNFLCTGVYSGFMYVALYLRSEQGLPIRYDSTFSE